MVALLSCRLRLSRHALFLPGPVTAASFIKPSALNDGILTKNLSLWVHVSGVWVGT
jgi:hypothetical protein